MEKNLGLTNLLTVIFIGILATSCSTREDKSKVTGSWIGELRGFERIGGKSSGIFVKKVTPFPRITALTLKSAEITFSNETNLNIVSNQTYYKVREIFFNTMQQAVPASYKKIETLTNQHYFLRIALTDVTLTKRDGVAKNVQNNIQIFNLKKATIQAELRNSITNSRHAIILHTLKQPNVEINMLTNIFSTLANKLYKDIRVIMAATK